jgi:ABC-type glycerol-3-phosphate transport system permease component
MHSASWQCFRGVNPKVKIYAAGPGWLTTLFNFAGQYSTQYNLLFMNILLITIPPLIMFLFVNRQIVAGMTSGAVKG